MRKSYKRMLQISSAFGLILSVTNSYAIDCTPTPDCVTLGYTKTASDCSGVAAIKCPFDTSKVFCEEKILTKTCDSVGDVLYGDGTCAISPDKLDSSRTPIGIVFDTSHRLAMALIDVKQNGSAGSEKMKWSSSYCDTPNLENCTDTSTMTISCGLDGRANTDAILASTCNGTTYAANAVNAYQTSNCSADFCQKGKWFLPSMRDLNTIYSFKSVINNSLTLLASQGASNLQENYYWSSTESSNLGAWGLRMDNRYEGYSYKSGNTYYVRPVVKY